MDQRSTALNRISSGFQQEKVLDVDVRGLRTAVSAARHRLDFKVRLALVADVPLQRAALEYAPRGASDERLQRVTLRLQWGSKEAD